MSSAAHANSALNLVTDKIVRLTLRAQKLKESDPTGMQLAHDIAVTLASAFAQHGNDATSLSPILLSCAAEIRDKSGPDCKLKALPDWTTVSNEDGRIRSHPLFKKTCGYRPPSSPPTMAASSLPVPPVKHHLFVRGSLNVDKKRRASTPERADAPAPEVKRQKIANTPGERSPLPEKRLVLGRAPPRSRSRAPPRKTKSKEFVSDNEGDDLTTKDSIVVVKRKATVGRSGLIEPGTAGSSKPVKPAASAMEGSTSIFRVTCERCIKDDIPCEIILSKKSGEIRRCCRNCDEKKAKCIRPDAERADLLRRTVAAKKAKAAAEKSSKGSGPSRATSRSRPKVSMRTRSISRKPSGPSAEKLGQDAEGEDDTDTAISTQAITQGDELINVVTPNDNIGETQSAGRENSDRPQRQPQAKEPPTEVLVVASDVETNILPETEVVQTDVIIQSVAQPTALVILQGIETLGRKFDTLLKTSGERSETLHQAMESRLNSIDDHWAKKFAAMEERLQDVEMKTAGNTMSIGHMANAVNVFYKTGTPTALSPPPTASSQMSDLPLPEGQTLCNIGNELATIRHDSRGLPASAFNNTSASVTGPSSASSVPLDKFSQNT